MQTISLLALYCIYLIISVCYARCLITLWLQGLLSAFSQSCVRAAGGAGEVRPADGSLTSRWQPLRPESPVCQCPKSTADQQCSLWEVSSSHPLSSFPPPSQSSSCVKYLWLFCAPKACIDHTHSSCLLDSVIFHISSRMLLLYLLFRLCFLVLKLLFTACIAGEWIRLSHVVVKCRTLNLKNVLMMVYKRTHVVLTQLVCWECAYVW